MKHWGLRRATQADGESIASMLARAFEKDGAMGWMVREGAERAAAMRGYFDAVYRHLSEPHGLCFTEHEGLGASLWIPPGKWELGLWQQVRLAPAMVRAFGWRKLKRSNDSINLVTAQHPAKPHYYLLILGVEPSHQGQGLGKALMDPVLARCDAEGIGAFLETGNEANLPLYRSRGFEVTHTLPLAGGGPLMYFMWREPRAASTPSAGR